MFAVGICLIAAAVAAVAIVLTNINTVTSYSDVYYRYVSLLLNGKGTANGTTIIDRSTPVKTIVNAGTVVNGVSQSKFGSYSLSFSGTSTDYLTVNATSELSFGSDPFTVEAWVYLSPLPSLTQYKIINNYGTSSTRSWSLYINATTGPTYTIVFETSPDGSDTNMVQAYSTSVSLSASTWYHIAVVKTSTAAAIYFNGTDVTSVSTTASTLFDCSTYATYIGVASDGSYPFKGYIDDLRVTKGIARYSSNFSTNSVEFPIGNFCSIPSNLALLVHGNGTAGTGNFIDDSYNTKTLTGHGTAAHSSTTSKFKGTSIKLTNATNSNIYIPATTDLTFGSNDFTIETFINFTTLPATNDWSTIVARWYITGTKSWLFALYNDAGNYKLELATGDSSSQVVALSNTLTISTGTWYHIAVVKSGTSAYFYLDGAPVGTGIAVANLVASTQIAIIGVTGINTSLSNPLGAYLAELRIMNGIGIYGSAFTPSTTPFPNAVDSNYQFTSLVLHGDGTDSSSTVTDSSIVPKTITAFDSAMNSATQFKTGTASLHFPGTNTSYLEVTNSNIDFDFGSNLFTIEAYINFDSLPAFGTPQNIIGSWDPSATFSMIWYVSIYDSGSGIYKVLVGSGTGASQTSTSSPAITISANTWFHLAVVKTASTTLTYYIDGVYIGTSTCKNPIGSIVAPVTVGVRGSSTSGYTNPFGGYLDELIVTKGVAKYTGTTSFTPKTYRINP
jgi:hypothetical protein